MTRTVLHGVLSCFVTVVVISADRQGLGSESPTLQFNRDIRPLLSANCFACHGFDGKSRAADLRLDLRESAVADRPQGPAIRPGDPAGSTLWQRIQSTDPDTQMPPPTSHKSLTAAEQETLRRWILEGASYQRHWAFEPPASHPLPLVQAQDWCRNPIDYFILRTLEDRQLTPSREAPAHTLIRRVSLALTGLPPTPLEVQSFLHDTSPDAYERMVDRYLQSPHFGEERARHWLDLARYADTHGLHLDNERLIWPYRDWVIRVLNDNMPFDQFTREQLAGDLLPHASSSQKIATGFLRCNVTTSEGGAIESEFLYRYAVERASTTMQTWMGLTGGCAVCHDHKFDPLTSREFYSFYAFFASAADPGLDGNVINTFPVLKLADADQRQQLALVDAAESTAEQQLLRSAERLSCAGQSISTHASPLPAPQGDSITIEDTWLDDDFPFATRMKASTRNSPHWTIPEQVRAHHGRRSLYQAGPWACEDTFEAGAISLTVPNPGRLAVDVQLSDHDRPLAICLTITTASKSVSVVWGDPAALAGTKITSAERIRVGDLPPSGTWHTLSVDTRQLGLPAGTAVNAVALGVRGGVVWWDHCRVSGTIPTSSDLRSSWDAWRQHWQGQTPPWLPKDLVAGLAHNASPADTNRLKAFYTAHVARSADGNLQRYRDQYAEARITRRIAHDRLPDSLIFSERAEPRETFVMLRGQYDKPGEKVTPNVPQALPPLPANATPRPTRLDLANWLVGPDHPLTARVTVNRFWQEFMGVGLVATSFDFGSQGEPPSHPELLDWLALQFQSNWDVKALCRLIVTSATFRQASDTTADLLRRDPANRWYARGPRFRLDAEQIRDNALFVAGLLNPQMGGRGVHPYQPPQIWEPVGYSDSNTRHFLQGHGPDLYRRSIYTFLKRTAPPPFMSNFDAPNREQFCTKRERSNTPLQSLQLLNDVQHVEAARGLAAQMIRVQTSPVDRLQWGFATVLARQPDSRELQTLTAALDAWEQTYQQQPAAAAALAGYGESRVGHDLDPAELAAYTLTANLILNLDETLCRN